MEYSKQALWLRFLISEVFGSNLELTTSLLGQTTALSREQPFFIRWVIHNGSICLIYFMEDIIADTLTKPLSSTRRSISLLSLDFAQGPGMRTLPYTYY